MADADLPLKTYRGNCHCGAFVYEAQMPEIQSVGECNCSICYKKGYLWVFPKAENFKIVKGDSETLKGYTFGPATTVHKFCPSCGTSVMAVRGDGSSGIGLNARSIQGLNTWELKRNAFDGKSKGPAYEPPQYAGPQPDIDIDGAKLYTGSCHCGAVTVALKSLPLDKDYPARIIECNCSICERNAYIWVYPKKEQVVVQGEENLSARQFAREMMSKTFCKTCGVPMTNAPRELGDEQHAALSDFDKGWYERVRVMHPVNLRVLNGFHVSEAKDAERVDGAERQPPYVNP